MCPCSMSTNMLGMAGIICVYGLWWPHGWSLHQHHGASTVSYTHFSAEQSITGWELLLQRPRSQAINISIEHYPLSSST